MKITHINTRDVAGGAARAAYRLHTGLCRLGHDSQLLVQFKQSSDTTVIRFEPPSDVRTRVRRGLQRRFLAWSQKAITGRPIGASEFTDDRSQHASDFLGQVPTADILHLHWVASSIDYRKFFQRLPRQLPLVWTLHDMNPFTGGCHFDEGCGKFSQRCGACPQLYSSKTQDFSAQVWGRKSHAFAWLGANSMRIVTPSRWLAEAARKSSLFGRFQVNVIPYGVDTECFQPRDRQIARRNLKIPQDARVVLFVADYPSDKRKGLPLFLEAIKALSEPPGLYFLAVGNRTAALEFEKSVATMEYVGDEQTLSLVYSAADLFVIPSLQDNLPLTALEALACGVPTVGFAVGGLPEIVRDGYTGSLASPGDVRALRNAIADLLQNQQRLMSMAQASRRIAVQEYRLDIQARRYLCLYETLRKGDTSEN